MKALLQDKYWETDFKYGILKAGKIPDIADLKKKLKTLNDVEGFKDEEKIKKVEAAIGHLKALKAEGCKEYNELLKAYLDSA